MTNKYFAGNKGHYIFCDICGQPCYIWEATRLTQETGRGGLLVCPEDSDDIDFSLIPYKVPNEKTVRWARLNHNTTVSNGSDPIDLETDDIGV